MAAFLDRRIRFVDMPQVARLTMEKAAFVAVPTLADLMASNGEARAIAAEIVERM